MTSKKYVAYVAAILYVFIMINLAIWHGITKEVILMDDINRSGGFKTQPSLTENIHYNLHHTELADYIRSGKSESFDVLTIGDSFTNGIDGSSYPDYLVNHYGLRVINGKAKNHCVLDLYTLLKTGILDEIKPKVVILESVERQVRKRLGVSEHRLEDATVFSREEIASIKPSITAKSISSGILPPVLVQWNITFFRNKIVHLLNPEKLSPTAYIMKLNRPFFTNPGQEDILLCYDVDIDYLQYPLNTMNAEMVNQNLNTAARILKAKGIKLIFFAAADKYDLYYPYILDKKGRPENPFFQKMRDVQGKEYIFVDTMTPLRQAIERGEKDLYWLGDGHWSHKGIKIVCDEIVKYILPELR